MKSFLLTFAVFLCAFHTLVAQQPPQVTFEKVGGKLSIIRVENGKNLVGANMLLYASGEDLILVDTNLPHPQLVAYIQSQVKQYLGTDELEIKTIFITHWHPDHSGGIEHWREKANVIAQVNTKTTLSQPQKGFGLGKVGAVSEFPARLANGLPAETFDKAFEMKMNGENIVALHLNGHTNGDLIVHFKSQNVIHVGDLVWPKTFPFTDNHNGGNALELLRSLEELKSLSDRKTVFVPGHGNTFDRSYLNKYIVMVEGTIEHIRKLKEAGNNADKIKADGLQEWSEWASVLVPEEVWIEMVLKSLEAS